MEHGENSNPRPGDVVRIISTDVAGLDEETAALMRRMTGMTAPVLWLESAGDTPMAWVGGDVDLPCFLDELEVVERADRDDFTAAARTKLWAAGLTIRRKQVLSWGLRGWDTPDWPYARFFAWRSGRDIVVAANYEGDVTTATFKATEPHRAVAWLHEHIAWGWARGLGGPGADVELTDEHHGPFIEALMPALLEEMQP